jgi:hypothetical protein
MQSVDQAIVLECVSGHRLKGINPTPWAYVLIEYRGERRSFESFGQTEADAYSNCLKQALDNWLPSYVAIWMPPSPNIAISMKP